MEALSVAEIPTGRAWQYEPKWDGFRCVVFRDRGKVELQSKSGRSLTRYFPELVGAILEVEADAFVIDGEIVVPQNGAFSFDALLQRIHPAPSRVKRLAAETPALLIVFDLLAGFRSEDSEATSYTREFPLSATADYYDFLDLMLRNDLSASEALRLHVRSRNYAQFLRLLSALERAEALNARVLID